MGKWIDKQIYFLFPQKAGLQMSAHRAVFILGVLLADQPRGQGDGQRSSAGDIVPWEGHPRVTDGAARRSHIQASCPWGDEGV